MKSNRYNLFALLRTAGALALGISFAASAFAAVRQEFDFSSGFAPYKVPLEHLRAMQNDPSLRALATVSQTDERFGVPTFVWGSRSSLQASSAVTGRRSPASLAQSARTYAEKLAPLYRLAESDVAGALVQNIHDTGRGGIIVSFRQSVGGVEVFRDEMKIMMDRNLNLVASAGYIASVAEAKRAGLRDFTFTEAQAVAKALADYAGGPVGSAFLAGDAEGGYRNYDAYSSLMNVDPEERMTRLVRAHQTLFHVPGELIPAYYIELMNETEGYAYVVSAIDGMILFRHRITETDSFTYRVWADNTALNTPYDGPQGNDPTPHPTGTPNNYNPPYVAPVLRTLQNGPISTNDPWLPPGATETNGNNVDAYADITAPDGLTAGDFRASTTSASTFDRTYNVNQAPNVSQAQQMASVTQHFYVNNWLHDWFYDAGFNEASGNAQANNLGRGGVQGDVLHAEAQDNSGTNNANMSTPADGGSPRQQMYVFTTTGGQTANLIVNPPSSAAGTYAVGTSTTFGPQTFDVTADVVLVIDPTAPVNDGCETPFTNAASLPGKIALIDRSATCTYPVKVKNAQNAGAVGVIIANTSLGTINMTGTDATITIPVLSISVSNGNTIKSALTSGPVNARLVRAIAVNHDGTIDNQIVAHEWGHYISNRLIGNASGLIAGQSRGMGEGWGDFTAMIMTVKPEDAVVPSNPNYNGVYALAAYAVINNLVPDNSYYYGIRRLPYSSDFAKNALTFKHVTNGVALPVGPPTAFGASGANNAEVHNAGEVWCSMLWECYSSLLRDTGRLTFDQARTRMRDYLVASYKMTQPTAPTFTEGRDAVLAAAYAGDFADYTLFCAAFAKRGCGIGAVSPDRFSTTNAGATESFVCGGDIALTDASLVDDVLSCDTDGYLDSGEIGTLSVTLKNVGSTTLSATTGTVSSTNGNVSFPAGNTINFASSTPYSSVSGSVQVQLAGAGQQVIDLKIDYNDPGLLIAGPRTFTQNSYGNVDDAPSASDDFEERSPNWTYSGNTPVTADRVWRRLELTGTSHVLYGPDAGSPSDMFAISPPMLVGPGTFSFTFQHAFQFEDATTSFDGGVIEITNNGGGIWTDIGASAVPTYNGTVSANPNNPLTGRPAFVRTSSGYPTLNLCTVSLGGTYANQTVQVRFRIGTDDLLGLAGWRVDNFVPTGITNTPFLALGPESGPVASSVSVVASPDPVVVGQNVTYTATVTPSTSVGSVNFADQFGALGSAPVVSGTAQLVLPAAGVGTHNVTASYPANACFTASSSSPYDLDVVADQPPSVTVTAPNGGEDIIVGSSTNLTWTASDDVGVASVTLEISRDNGSNYAPIATDIPNSGTYNWTVTGPGTNTNATPVFTALFKVRAKDTANQTTEDVSDAAFSIFDPGVSAVDGPTPSEFALARVWPNPTTGSFGAEFAVARMANIRLSLVDLQGREVRVLASGSYPAGRYHAGWNGRLASGGIAPTGMYFVRFHTPEKDFVTRVIVTR